KGVSFNSEMDFSLDFSHKSFIAVFGALAALSSSLGLPPSGLVFISFKGIPPAKKNTGGRRRPPGKWQIHGCYTPLRASSGLVVISWYRRVLRGKLFSKGTMFPAQRMRPQPADTL